MSEQAAAAQADTQPSTSMHVWDTELPGAMFRIESQIRRGTDKKFAKQLRRHKDKNQGRFIIAAVFDETPDLQTLWATASSEAQLLDCVRFLLAHSRQHGRTLKVKPHLISASTEAAICALPEWLI